MCQSIARLTIPSPAKPPRNFFEKANFPIPGHKGIAKPQPLGQVNCPKTPPLGQLFSKIQQKTTKHETEIMKNSTEMLICLKIL